MPTPIYCVAGASSRSSRRPPRAWIVGLKLKGDKPTERLTPAGNWNSMAMHRVRIADASELDTKLLARLRDAYDRAA